MGKVRVWKMTQIGVAQNATFMSHAKVEAWGTPPRNWRPGPVVLEEWAEAHLREGDFNGLVTIQVQDDPDLPMAVRNPYERGYRLPKRPTCNCFGFDHCRCVYPEPTFTIGKQAQLVEDGSLMVSIAIDFSGCFLVQSNPDASGWVPQRTTMAAWGTVLQTAGMGQTGEARGEASASTSTQLTLSTTESLLRIFGLGDFVTEPHVRGLQEELQRKGLMVAGPEPKVGSAPFLHGISSIYATAEQVRILREVMGPMLQRGSAQPTAGPSGNR